MQIRILICLSLLFLKVVREISTDEAAHTTVAVSVSGRVIFTGTTSGSIRAIEYPLPRQKEWIMHQAHCGPITKVLSIPFFLFIIINCCLWRLISQSLHSPRSCKWWQLNSLYIFKNISLLIPKIFFSVLAGRWGSPRSNLIVTIWLLFKAIMVTWGLL